MAYLRHGFAFPGLLLVLAITPALAGLAVWARRARRQALARLGRPSALRALTNQPRDWPRLRGLGWALGLGLLLVGSAGPQWGRDPEQATTPGRDLVVLLDVSRSMLAEDVFDPRGGKVVRDNRLEQAKRGLAELADALQRKGGHRVGLVVFASRALVVCPLTHDYDHFREKLEDFTATYLPPALRTNGEEARSGTRLGEGLEAAVGAHDPRLRGFQDILLISDGDDPAEDADDDREAGITAARLASVPVYTVGVGNPEGEGARIPLPTGGFLTHRGAVIRTQLREEPLQAIAQRTGGIYTAARTDSPRLPEMFRDRIEPGPTREDTGEPLPVYRQRQAWFLGPALVLLTLALTLGRMKAEG